MRNLIRTKRLLKSAGSLRITLVYAPSSPRTARPGTPSHPIPSTPNHNPVFIRQAQTRSTRSDTVPPTPIDLPLQLPRHRAPHIAIKHQTRIPQKPIIPLLAQYQLMSLSETRIHLTMSGQVRGVEPGAVALRGSEMGRRRSWRGGGRGQGWGS